MVSDRKLSMLMDFYEITMSNGYFELGYTDKIVVFDMFFRKVPDDGGFAIMAGLEMFIEEINHFSFTHEDIEFLKKQGVFSKPFLDYLKNFSFHCNIWAVPEGTPIFPSEPIVTVEGPYIEAQMIETLLLLTFNYQSLICTKANRIKRACQGRSVMEFGARRAQGPDAANFGARAAYIGGCDSTSNVQAAQMFGIPCVGTMAHSWVQTFESEYEAFKAYAKLYPNNCVLLVDTYSVLKSGVPNAIKVFDEVLKPLGIKTAGIRIDSGDIAYLSKKARKMLDQAGYTQVKISVSNSLDEYLVRDLLLQQAQVDSFGIGENLITAKSDPVFGGVYKLAAIKKGETYIPRMKVSETVEKITTPCLKALWRLYDIETGKAMADYITRYDEEINISEGLTLFDSVEIWKKRTFKGCRIQRLNIPIFIQGKQVYQSPTLEEIKQFCIEQVNTLWEEVKRFENPHKYYVDLSQTLWDERQNLLNNINRTI